MVETETCPSPPSSLPILLQARFSSLVPAASQPTANMRFCTPALLVLASAASALADSACLSCGAANNDCQRAVMGTGAHIAIPLATRLADCSAAIAVTVTPQPV